jgi:hypothetical protein
MVEAERLSAESIMTALFHGFVVSGSTGFYVGTHDGHMWLRQRGHPAVRFSPPEMRLESIRWSHGGASKAGHFQFCFQVPSRGQSPRNASGSIAPALSPSIYRSRHRGVYGTGGWKAPFWQWARLASRGPVLNLAPSATSVFNNVPDRVLKNRPAWRTRCVDERAR